MKKKSFIILYFFAAASVSFGLGLIFSDQYMLGSISLFFGFTEVYFANIGSWAEKLVGIFENIMSMVICFFAALYGSVIFTVCIVIPILVFGIINWKKHEMDNEVQLNKMTWKMSIVVILICLAATAIVAFLISLIPGQNLPILDSVVNILNVCGIILLALRYKEAWYVWIICNALDIVTWALVLANNFSQNAIMMIIKCTIYIALDIWGLIAFIKLRRKQEIKTGGDYINDELQPEVGKN